MTSHYDSYDYPSYWKERVYEHEVEALALKSFFKILPKVKTVLEVGAGFGRLAPIYVDQAEKIILSDPSAKLLKLAQKKFKSKKITFIVSDIEGLPAKIKDGSVDIILMIRVLHHIKNLKRAFSVIYKLLKPGGYFILEFPNKVHAKAVISEFIKGNFTFPLDIFPKEVYRKKTVKIRTIPFVNYHPDVIKELLKNHGFKIRRVKSVSNFRSPFFKKIIPLNVLTKLSALTQDIFAGFTFGPSLFILAKKDN